jgi:regulation of enolase protein 1 (concanavalin A-like superfamily)
VARVDFYANGALVGSATASPHTYSWSNVAAGSYSITAVATDTAGLRTTSGAVSITVTGSAGSGGSTALPAGWTDYDVGSVGVVGSAAYTGGTFTVKGAGADIWGSADSFNYVYQPLIGDGQIVARVAALQNTNAYAKAGVMIRETLNPGAAQVTLDVKPGGGIELLSRLTTGGATTAVGGTASAPVWVKLVRAGTTITGYFSTDGSTWTKAGSVTVTMATNVCAGLAVTSHTTSQLNTATFDNVLVAAGAAPPPPTSTSPLADLDIGGVGLPGSASYSNGTYTIKGAGADIWGTADSFNFAYQALNGDGQVVARVASLQNTHVYAKAGVMIRETLTAGARSILLSVKPGGGLEFLGRTATGGSTSSLASGTGSAPIWLKLVRAGATIAAYSSTNGSTWTTVGSATVTMAASVYVGLAVCSHNTAALNTATFDNVAIAATATTPALAYTDSDIGPVGLAGSASFSNGTYTVKGAGADVWGTADAFNFAYVPLAGNGQMIARVATVQNTNALAKAGVMIRETTAANASHVLLDVKPGGGVELLARTATGGATSYVAGTTGTAPEWLKLVRSGTTITGYTSNDGTTWTAVGNVTVSMASNVYIGLAVCSRTTSALNSSTFDNVSKQ